MIPAGTVQLRLVHVLAALADGPQSVTTLRVVFPMHPAVRLSTLLYAWSLRQYVTRVGRDRGNHANPAVLWALTDAGRRALRATIDARRASAREEARALMYEYELRLKNHTVLGRGHCATALENAQSERGLST